MKKLFNNAKAFIGLLIGLDFIALGLILWAMALTTSNIIFLALTIVTGLISLDVANAITALYELMKK